MNTLFLLMALYGARAVVPIEAVCRDYFAHLSPDKFLRKISDGEIGLPIVRMEASQKSARGVHLADLAACVDERRAAALREAKALFG